MTTILETVVAVALAVCCGVMLGLLVRGQRLDERRNHRRWSERARTAAYVALATATILAVYEIRDEAQTRAAGFQHYANASCVRGNQLRQTLRTILNAEIAALPHDPVANAPRRRLTTAVSELHNTDCNAVRRQIRKNGG